MQIQRRATPRRAIRLLVAAAASSILGAGCTCGRDASRDQPSDAPHASVQPTRAPRHRPRTSSELPTTDAEIYLGNLDGQISELQRLLRERPEVSANWERLGAAHRLRGLYRGELDEVQKGLDAASRCIALEADSSSCHLLRAEAGQSLHRFEEARADVARAQALGGSTARIADLEAELDWNAGRYDRAIDAIRKARRERPSTATWLREAQLDHDLGLEEESDRAFEAAEDAIGDTAPLPVARLNLQRGIQLAERGLLEQACLFFREAIARMPSHVAAIEHLAETLHAMGRDDEAVALYERVVSLSDDPEFSHALAVLYRAHGKQERAAELEAVARTRYHALLEKYPGAMYWHASEFYLATSDAPKALDLLRKNVRLRSNSASYVALARAELANGHIAEATIAIDTALAMPPRSATLFATAFAVRRRAGDAAAAAAFREQALRMNPRVDLDEEADAAPDSGP